MRAHQLNSKPCLKAHRSAESRRKDMLRGTANYLLKEMQTGKRSDKTHCIQMIWGYAGCMDKLRLKWNNFEVCHSFKGERLVRACCHTQLGEGCVVTPEDNAAPAQYVKDRAARNGGMALCPDDVFE